MSVVISDDVLQATHMTEAEMTQEITIFLIESAQVTTETI